MNISHFSVVMSRCYSKHTIEPLPQQQKLFRIDLYDVQFSYTSDLDMLDLCYIGFLNRFCWIN